MLEGTIAGGIVGGAAGAAGATCFVEGTPVLAAEGLVLIEAISAGDIVWAEDPESGEQSLSSVVQTFENETEELVHVTVEGDTITSTPHHPFYSPVKGWMDAADLRVGDILVRSNGEYVIVEQVQHEILESPVKVYNFEVQDYHTYYAGCREVLVHNLCKPEAAVRGSKKHGVKWKEGPARAKATGKPQGQWAEADLKYATEMANTLKPGESGYFDLPKGAKSIVHMPDGTKLPATRMWIRNNGTGTWHGYPMR